MIFTPRMDILPPEQQKLWPELKRASEFGMVLYGGTAIALRLGHRPSVDFDFFTDRQLDHDAIIEAFPFVSRSHLRTSRPNTIDFFVPNADTPDKGVKVSFFGALNKIGRVGSPEMTQDSVLQVASLDDLMAMKVKVLLQRVEAKDYRDIAALIKANISLARGLSSAEKMWPNSFQSSESLKALTCFEGGDLHILTKAEKKILVDAVKVIGDLPAVSIVSLELADPTLLLQCSSAVIPRSQSAESHIASDRAKKPIGKLGKSK